MDSKNLFFETLSSFINDLTTVYPDYIDTINLFNVEKYTIEEHYTLSNKHSKDICSRNEVIFSKEIDFMSPIPFSNLYSQNITDKTRENIWKYIQNLYLYSYCHVKSENVLDILLLSKKPDIDWSTLDEEKTKIVAMFYKIKEKDVSLDGESGDQGESFLPKIGNVDIFDTKIGSLAKEISEDINLDDIDTDKLLSGIQGGNMDIESSGLMNLIQNIGNKVKDKMENSELDQDNLVNEANNIMGEFNKMGTDNPLNMLNSLFKDVAGNMANGGMPGGMPESQPPRNMTSKEKRNTKKKKEKNERKANKILEKSLNELHKK